MRRRRQIVLKTRKTATGVAAIAKLKETELTTDTVIEVRTDCQQLAKSVRLSPGESALLNASLEILLFRHNVAVGDGEYVCISILGEAA